MSDVSRNMNKEDDKVDSNQFLRSSTLLNQSTASTESLSKRPYSRESQQSRRGKEAAGDAAEGDGVAEAGGLNIYLHPIIT
jgi:hypothetical protein